MLTAEGNTCSRNLLRRSGNVVEFPLQYLVVIIKSITYLSFRFLSKYFACFKLTLEVFTVIMTSVLFKLNLFAGSRWDSPRGLVVKLQCWDKGPRFDPRRRCVFFLVFFLPFLLLLFFYHSYHKNDCLSRKDESFFNNRGHTEYRNIAWQGYK